MISKTLLLTLHIALTCNSAIATAVDKPMSESKVTDLSFSTAEPSEDLLSEAKFCLYNSYAAQKAFYEEYKYFSTSFSDLGVDNCSNFEINYYLNDEEFMIKIFDKETGKTIGSINNYKELLLNY